MHSLSTSIDWALRLSLMPAQTQGNLRASYGQAGTAVRSFHLNQWQPHLNPYPKVRRMTRNGQRSTVH